MIASIGPALMLPLVPVVIAVAVLWFAFFSRVGGFLRAVVCVGLLFIGWITVPSLATTMAQQTNGGPYVDIDAAIE